MTIRYSAGKVYKIATNAPNSKVYIGSTINKYLCRRLAVHKSQYRAYIRDAIDKQNCSSHEMFRTYGVDNCYITLLETVDCHSKDQLRMREQHYIDINDCVNKYNAYCSIAERIEKMKSYRVTFQEKHNDKHACNYCSFKTHSKSNFEQHKTSIKHRLNVGKTIDNWLRLNRL